MNTLKSNKADYDNGVVTENGFRALADAEGYDAASSIGACCNSVARLWQALKTKRALQLYEPGGNTLNVSSQAELGAWCFKHLPLSYGEYLRRNGR